MVLTNIKICRSFDQTEKVSSKKLIPLVFLIFNMDITMFLQYCTGAIICKYKRTF